MRKLYIWAEPSAVLGHGTVVGKAMADDGELLAEHYSSSLYWCKSDMGVGTSQRKHSLYREYFGDERFEIVDLTDLTPKELAEHVEFQQAFAKEPTGEQPA